MLRDIFWIAQPPLLCKASKEGNVADQTPRTIFIRDAARTFKHDPERFPGC